MHTYSHRQVLTACGQTKPVLFSAPTLQHKINEWSTAVTSEGIFCCCYCCYYYCACICKDFSAINHIKYLLLL